MAKYDLDPSTGGGAHMWRGEWNLAVSGIYRDLLSKSSPYIDDPDNQHHSRAGAEEPVYSKPPKPDRYADVRGKNRYFM